MSATRSLARAAVRATGAASAPLRPPPDFLVIGAKRGGTTSLYRYLLQHPSVVPMFPSPRLLPLRHEIKGTRYFTHHAARPPAWYRGFFPTAATRAAVAHRTGAAVAGEASPYYLFHPLAAERAARLVPAARLVAILRDPVERAHSHWRERTREGAEVLPFEAAVEAEAERLRGEEERICRDARYVSVAHEHHSYVSQSRYGAGLARWWARYPAERILVVRSEDFYADPRAVTATVCDFLGLPSFRFDVATRWNATEAAPMAAATRRRLEEALADDVAALEALVGRPFGW